MFLAEFKFRALVFPHVEQITTHVNAVMGLRGVPDKMTNVYENMTYYTVLNQNERE